MNPSKVAFWQSVKRVVRYRAFERRMHERSKSACHYWTLAVVAAITITAVLLAKYYEDTHQTSIEPVPCHEPTGATP